MDQHKRKRDMLANYYGQNAEEKGKEVNTSIDPLDINGATFKPDIYLTKLLRERSLTELMDKETEMVRHIRSLDSDMQTLVYENYNKFISATDTIRKVRKITFLPYSTDKTRLYAHKNDDELSRIFFVTPLKLAVSCDVISDIRPTYYMHYNLPRVIYFPSYGIV